MNKELLTAECRLLAVLNEMIFEMGEKLKEVRVTSEYSRVGLLTQVRMPLLCFIHIHALHLHKLTISDRQTQSSAILCNSE